MTQRPIKFRIAITSPHWDDEPGSTKLSEPLALGEIIDHKQIDFTDGGYIDWADIDWTADTVRYLQFTGLLDTNGVEIYEGDIVKYSSGQVSWTRQVLWDSVEACFGADSGDGDGSAWSLFGDEPQHYEVVGNTIENGDLLNAKA